MKTMLCLIALSSLASAGACLAAPPIGLTVGPPASVTMGPPASVTMGPPASVTMGPPASVTMGPPASVTMGPPASVTMGPPASVTLGPPATVTMGPPAGVTMGPPAGLPKGPPAGVLPNIASELGKLNAAHASSTALSRAAPNSAVGAIATYDAQMTTALALNDPAAKDAAIIAARQQLSASTNKELTVSAATRIDSMLGITGASPELGTKP
jgi:hypothetical protein